mmetsp:Transcript_50621/g.163832  ORF Transcript_50621/g.163832 Transcript_50621/m.163832 type:complete len:167 (+) Transcript_50621:201-701(+)
MVVNRSLPAKAHKVFQDSCSKERGSQLGTSYGVPWAARGPMDQFPEVRGFADRTVGGHSFAPRPASEAPPLAELTEKDFPARCAWFPKGVPHHNNNTSASLAATLGGGCAGGWQRSGGIKTMYATQFQSKNMRESLYESMKQDYSAQLQSLKAGNRSRSLPSLRRG